MKKITLFVVLAVTLNQLLAQSQTTYFDTISSYFEEAKKSTEDGVKLWDINLYSPILLVDPDTRKIFSNYPDSMRILRKTNSIYTGTLPESINIANTSINWSGRRWAMLILPLPSEKSDRINLMAHELFHVHQPTLGFKLYNPANNHLDSKEGRIYLRLELAALIQALNSEKQNDRLTFLHDALTFRKFRHSLFPQSNKTENELELNEGLAEYTGFMISTLSQKQAVKHFNQSIENFLLNPTFVRSFAYQTIPVYGYLLNKVDKSWNKKVSREANLTDYFIKAFKWKSKTDLKSRADKNQLKYNGTLINSQETEREEKIKHIIEENKKKFIELAHLEIQFEQMNISFDPGNIMPLEDKGTVYPNLRITDNWGILTVSNGALISPNWDKVSISSPEKFNDKTISGDGWILELSKGYHISKDDKTGNYKILKK